VSDEPNYRSWCPQCGPKVFVDEDGCCLMCGADAVGAGVDLALAILDDFATREGLRETLAAYAHEAWRGWMQHMASKAEVVCTRVTQTHEHWTQIEVPVDLVERWRRQMETPYADLPETEKESDRAEADKMIAILTGRKA
jgi:hypothetical protein